MYQFVEYNHACADIILKWRNKDKIRNISKNNKIISSDDHYKWIKNIDTKYLFLFKYYEEYVGFGQINKITNSKAYWGCYIGVDNALPGSGAILNLCIIKHAFEHFRFNYLFCEVLSNNPKALNMQLRIGFKLNENIINEINRNGKNIIVHNLSMYKNDWCKISDR